jgi:hypothetical protein
MVGTASFSTSITLSSGTTTSITSDPAEISCSTTCTLNVDWTSINPPYRTLDNLTNASDYVFVGNVTAAWTVASGDVPVNLYNVTVVTALKSPGDAPPLTPGSFFVVGEVGGTIAKETVTVNGYPTLNVDGTYVLFVTPSGGVCCVKGNLATPDAPFSLIVDRAIFPPIPVMTQGGPQGIFYVRGGDVYSLDNMYPQVDAWLPVKAHGVPLPQFIQEVQSVMTTANP